MSELFLFPCLEVLWPYCVLFIFGSWLNCEESKNPAPRRGGRETFLDSMWGEAIFKVEAWVVWGWPAFWCPDDATWREIVVNDFNWPVTVRWPDWLEIVMSLVRKIKLFEQCCLCQFVPAKNLPYSRQVELLTICNSGKMEFQCSALHCTWVYVFVSGSASSLWGTVKVLFWAEFFKDVVWVKSNTIAKLKLQWYFKMSHILPGAGQLLVLFVIWSHLCCLRKTCFLIHFFFLIFLTQLADLRSEILHVLYFCLYC